MRFIAPFRISIVVSSVHGVLDLFVRHIADQQSFDLLRGSFQFWKLKGLDEAQYLAESRLSADRTVESVFEHARHSAFSCQVFQLSCGMASKHSDLQLFVYAKKLRDRHAALESGMVAGIATGSEIEFLVVFLDISVDIVDEPPEILQIFLVGFAGFFAVIANPSDQPLSEDRYERGAEEKRLDPHIEEARDPRYSIVRMERGIKLVSGESTGQSAFGRLSIPHLPDHEDIRILS